MGRVMVPVCGDASMVATPPVRCQQGGGVPDASPAQRRRRSDGAIKAASRHPNSSWAFPDAQKSFFGLRGRLEVHKMSPKMFF